VARHLRINWHVVKDIHKAHLHKHYRNPNLKGLRYIGIDEFAVHKGQIYKTIVVDHETGRIVYVGNGRSKETLVKFWRGGKEIESKDRSCKLRPLRRIYFLSRAKCSRRDTCIR